MGYANRQLTGREASKGSVHPVQAGAPAAYATPAIARCAAALRDIAGAAATIERIGKPLAAIGASRVGVANPELLALVTCPRRSTTDIADCARPPKFELAISLVVEAVARNARR